MNDLIIETDNFHAYQNDKTFYTDEYTRILNNNFPTMKYKRRICENKTTVKYG